MDLEVDVTDLAAVRACVREVRPEAVIHLAAWTDVDGAEAREADAAAVNATGVGQRRGRGRRGRARPWSSPPPTTSSTARPAAATPRTTPPSPLGAYGRTKLAGERAALAAWPGGHRIARTAWLYGACGPQLRGHHARASAPSATS